jgi:uncharacterized protein (DUF1800 family)
MSLGRTKFALSFLCFSLACAVPQLLAKRDMASAPNDPRHALQALNRLTFGPRPGDIDQVLAVGVDRWIELQLHPDKIDDSALEARLEPLRTLHMSSKEISEDFPDPQEIRQIMNGKKSMPSDPARRAVYRVQLARLEEKKERKEEAGKNAPAASLPPKMNGTAERTPKASSMSPAATADTGSNDAANNGTRDNDSMTASAMPAAKDPTAKEKMTPEEENQARQREEQLYADLEVQKEVQQEIAQLPSLPPDQRFKKILAMPQQTQVAFADTLKGGKGQEYLEGLNPRQKETLIAMNNPANVITGELSQAKLLRAIYSQRQLEEVMTDFWFNHFNVFVDKGLDRILLTSYERDVIRPRALGKFEDLLVATAKSPAMLYYLDNYLSVGPDSAQALGLPSHPGPYRRPPPRPNAGKRRSGLNENYGRELLELHTLSVNGGYSQRDVTEAAKIFTGWTIDKPAEGGGFKFDPRMHEPGDKFVLGHKFKGKGESEGTELLHRLATSPQTAHFISLKLAQRFVADDPPPALVDRMAKTFLKKKGDIREVLETLFHSPEFWDDASYRAKVKTPLEFVASAVRATGADVADAAPLANQLRNMGMPLYGAQPPTGYSMKAETWVSSSSLLNRMNFALALTSGKIKGVKVDTARLASSSSPQPDAAATLSTLEASLVAGGVSKQTHDSITAQMAAKNNAPPKAENKAAARKPDAAAHPPDVNTIAGLLLGSPEFQRR